MEELPLKIARLLAKSATKKSLTTYPQLADAVGWYNRTGQGLGRPLSVVLEFCEHERIPLLTSIVCASGTASPSPRGVAAMQQLLQREVDIPQEQAAVYRYDWTAVDALGLNTSDLDMNFTRVFGLFASEFLPEHKPQDDFSSVGTDAEFLSLSSAKPVLVAHFCQPQISPVLVQRAETVSSAARLMGLTEISQTWPKISNPPDRTFSNQVEQSSAVKRAWRFMRPPLAISTLVDHKPIEGLRINSLFKLSNREVGEILQYDLVEVEVYGQLREVPPYAPAEPAIHTYMVICRNDQLANATKAPAGNFLVKIGVSNDRERRLQELNGNHIAVIFGIRFQKYASGTWATQSMALEAERRAHEWCHANGTHASGEYFYLHEKQLNQAASFVFNS